MNTESNRRSRFSFNHLFLIAVVAGCVLILGIQSQRYYVWRRAARTTSELGAFVEFDWFSSRHTWDIVPQAICDFICIPTLQEVTFHGNWSPPPPPHLAMSSYYFPMCENADDAKLRKLVSALSGLQNCPKLSLIGTDVTEEGLRDLQRLHRLEELDLTGGQVSSRGVQYLRKVHLESLNLSYTQVSDSDIPTLASMRQLRTLDVSNTKITGAGVKRLRIRLPNCTVIRAESDGEEEGTSLIIEKAK